MQLDRQPSFWRCDAPVAAISLAVATGVLLMEHAKVNLWLPDAVLFPLALTASVALLWRRHRPVPVALISGAVAVLCFAGGSHMGAAALVLALYALARFGRTATSMVVGAAVILSAVVTTGIFDSPNSAISVGLWLTLWLETGIIVGTVRRRNEQRLRAAHERALEAERTREETARRRAAEERLRLARELHDSLTHAISVVNVQSSVALHVLPREPSQAEAALRHIRQASAEAMRELRATLRALRVADEERSMGVTQLRRLAAACQSQRVDLRVEIDEDDLPETVSRTVFRIVQEALTNVSRHSDAGSVLVTVGGDSEIVTVLVRDDGSACDDGEVVEGWGLLGMRERVAALGGTLRAGPAESGGFEVAARLRVSHTEVEEAA